MMLSNKYQELLNKLISGEITEAERQILQRASLDDPFLADALEGYSLNDYDAKAVNELREKIQPKKERRSRQIYLRIASVAASLLLLVAFSFWFFQNSQESIKLSTAEKSVAKNEASEINLASDTESQKEGILPNPSEEVAVSNKNKLEPRVKKKKEVKKDVNQRETHTEEKKQVPAPVKDSSKPQLEEIVEDQVTIPIKEEVQEVVTFEKSKDIDIAYDPDFQPRQGNIYVEPTPENINEEEIQIQETKHGDIITESAKENKPVASAKKKSKKVLDAVKPLPAKQIVGVVHDQEGKPLAGVDILNYNKEKLTSTDAEGQFTLNNADGYIISAFSGYDTVTVNISPKLSISMQKTADSFSEPHKRMVDMMTDVDLGKKYAEEMHLIFSRNWPVCDRNNYNGQTQPLRNNVSLNIVINEFGKIDDLDFFSEIDEACLRRIEELFIQAQDKNIFETNRPLQFRFQINL